jgi:hypothetical protein
MDILLRKKYTYNLPDSFERTKEKLQAASKDRFSNFSSRLPEIIGEDGSFNLRSNFSLFSAVNYGQTIYLKGKIAPTTEGTTVNIILTPNFVFLIVFYLLPVVSLNVLFGDNSILGSKTTRFNNFMVIVMFEIAIFSVVGISSYFMKRKFEKAMKFS